MNIVIVVERHSNMFYMARAEDEHSLKPSAEGKSAGEAIGNFIIRNKERFGITIQYRFEEINDKSKEEKR